MNMPLTAPLRGRLHSEINRPATQRVQVAVGPVMPGWGSWEWIGADLVEELRRYHATAAFAADAWPEGDVVVVVKQAPSLRWLEVVRRRARVIYCPVDYYGSLQEIEADGPMLAACALIVVHCERLRPLFTPYAPVEYVDHHVKFTAPLRDRYPEHGPIVWVGVRTNLPPLVEWVNAHPLPAPLWVLTNPEKPGPLVPEEFGFRRDRQVRIEAWSAAKQRAWTALARAALDIKGDDFRWRHKPPAKALDFLASGVPLAMNPDASAVEHLARWGFDVVVPLDTERWLGRAYWEETQRFGAAMRELLSLERLGRRYRRLIDQVIHGTWRHV